MLQRVQTVYMILIAAVMGLFASMDVFVLARGAESAIVDAWQIHTPQGSLPGAWGIGALSVVSALVAVVEIFLYRRRVLQSRVGMFNVLLLAGLCLYIGYTGYSLSADAEVGLRVSLALPAICVVLQVMAIRGVLADEALVRMSNRLR